MSITPLPPAPAPTDSTQQFNEKAFDWVASLGDFTTEANALAVSVNSDKNTAAGSASAAQASATASASSASASAVSASAALGHASAAAANTNAPLWVSGTTYAAGALVYSALTGRTYRRKTAGSGTTDPSADTANWTALFLEIQTQRPTIRPSLLLDFANTKRLDSRVTFTRASAGRVYDGRSTAKAEENLVLHSQDYSQTAWTKTNITPVTGKTAPDGTSTATEFTASAANGTLTQAVTAISGDYTFSVFLRRVTGTGNVDISSHSGGTWVTQTLTSTWTRFTVTQTLTAGSRTPGVRIVDSGDVIEVWGAQLEQRSAVTSYTATTNQPITNYIPVLQSAADNVARFDHNPVTGESLGFLVEESRTNLLTYSSQFDDAAWTKSNSTITANTIVAPDGTLTGDKLIEGSGSNSFNVNRTSTGTTNTNPYTLSCHVKAGERTDVRLRIVEGTLFGRASSCIFNLSAGTAGSVVDANGSTSSASMVNLGNGWYRCILTVTLGGADTNLVDQINIISGGNATYTGDGYSGIYIWGAQLEAGAFPTSYIPTVASQVTRAADAASMTGANFSSWYRADEGTLYAEASKFAGVIASLIFSVDGTTSANRMSFVYVAPTTLRFRSITNSVTDVEISQTISSTGYIRASGAYKINDFAISTNGDIVGTDTSALVTPATLLSIGSQVNATSGFLNGHIRKLSYYPQRLSNANLQALTS